METHNIISTPDITGNISSCETKTQVVDSGRTFWKLEKTTLATNNCTGAVERFNTWEFSGASFFFGCVLPIVAMITIIFIAAAVSDAKTSSNRY